jgi:hypothetical protein
MRTREYIVISYEIISTKDGYMVEALSDDAEYIHAPNGDNLFDTYAEACTVLANYLLKEVAR